MRLLSVEDNAYLRTFFGAVSGWDLGENSPQVRWRGSEVYITAPWPEYLQCSEIQLSDIGVARHKQGFILGLDQAGRQVMAMMDDTMPDLLVSGKPGSGKSTAMHTVAIQLDGQKVYIDGKGGQGLAPLNGFRGQVGPLAVSLSDAIRALGWVYDLICKRNQELGTGKKLVDEYQPVFVFIDEFHTFTSNKTFSRLLYLCSAQGRSAKVFLVIGTHSPNQRMFGTAEGSTSTRMLYESLALRVRDSTASNIAVGGSFPHAHYLQDKGDSWFITGSEMRHTQIAYVPTTQLQKLGGGEPQMHRWPKFKSELLEQPDGVEVLDNCEFTPTELTVALRGALEDHGRPWHKEMLNKVADGMGSERIDDRLRVVGQEMAQVWKEIGGQNVTFRKFIGAVRRTTDKRV